MKILRLLITILAIFVIASTSMALPEMLDSFNTKYNTKGTALDTCDLCHVSGQPQISSCNEDCHVPYKPQKIDPVNLNPYGKSLKAHLNMPVDQALIAIEKIDSAGDRIPNIDKIQNLTFPGNIKGQKTLTTGNKNPLSELIDMFNNIPIPQKTIPPLPPLPP
jgi:hypothetical protein